MEFRTVVDLPTSSWTISPCERMLFVGSCFADNIGHRFIDERFRAVVNPFGVMYNPASIVHTVERLLHDDALPFAEQETGTCVFTLGTNHVYILKETGEIVDNCRKRPQRLFEERELTVEECARYLEEAIRLIRDRFPRVRFMLTVSPIRYRKYGYHGSQLSKATLLLAEKAVQQGALNSDGAIAYFPAYEIILDELRDYRFYQSDMLHPSAQAVDYIFERLGEAYFSEETQAFLERWRPIREAISHRPFHPESKEYEAFVEKVRKKLAALVADYPDMPLQGIPETFLENEHI